MLGIEFIGSVIIGLFVGLVSSLLGLGGGVVIVPLLPIVSGISARETIGTSLLTVFLVAAANTWIFHSMRLVVWRSGLLIGGFAALGSSVAALVTGYVSVVALHGVMAIVMLLIAYLSFHKPKAVRVTDDVSDGVNARPVSHASESSASRLLSSAIGLAGGLVSGFTGIGGGVLITPLLARLKGIASDKVVPTANAAILMTSFAGATVMIRDGLARGEGGSFGLVRIDLAAAVFFGAQITSRYGRRMQRHLDPRKRDWLIGMLLIGLALKTISSAFGAL